jgi:hypothetical protein
MAASCFPAKAPVAITVATSAVRLYALDIE